MCLDVITHSLGIVTMNDVSNPEIAVLKTLASQTKKVLPKAKQLYDENRAIRGKNRGGTIILQNQVTEVIGRITGNPKESGWLNAAFQKLGHGIVAPVELFERIAVKEWLSDEGVQELFFEIVSETLTESSGDISSPKKILAEKYSFHTGEREEYASYAIDIVVHTIIASIISPLKSDLALKSLGILIQQEGSETRSAVSEALDQKISALDVGPRQKIHKQLFAKTENVNEPILQT